jgi:hypothetical protein
MVGEEEARQGESLTEETRVRDKRAFEKWNAWTFHSFWLAKATIKVNSAGRFETRKLSEGVRRHSSLEPQNHSGQAISTPPRWWANSLLQLELPYANVNI